MLIGVVHHAKLEVLTKATFSAEAQTRTGTLEAERKTDLTALLEGRATPAFLDIERAILGGVRSRKVREGGSCCLPAARMPFACFSPA